MNRTISYQLKSTDFPGAEKLTVKGYLKSRGYSVQNMKVLRHYPEGILLNNRVTHLNAALSPGDLLTIHIREENSSENILPVDLPLDIIYEDRDLLVVNKPAGMPIHPSQNNRDNSLANALAYRYRQLGQPFVFRCINRLDRDTSGLTIVAKHMVSAGILGTYVAAKARNLKPDASPAGPGCSDPGDSQCSGSLPAPVLSREYLAIVRGQVEPAAGTICVPLGRKPGSIIERCVDMEHGEKAVTHYRTLKTTNGHTLVSLVLETGRTHQIRIHMKHIGFPLIGDYLYNPDMELIGRQALHSYRLRFPHPITGEPMEFTAPLPRDMEQVLGFPWP